MTTVLLVVAVVCLVATYLTWLAARVDRLHARCDAGAAALDAALVRRAAAAERLAAAVGGDLDPATRAELSDAAAGAFAARGTGADREPAESRLTRALGAVPADRRGPWAEQLATAAARVRMARQFHNDAVRDARAVRLRPVPRYLGLGSGRPMPEFFEFDDTD